jgi:hypothetical protein
MKLIILLTFLFSVHVFSATFVPQIRLLSLDTELYIEDRNTGAGETFGASSSSFLEFKFRYLFSQSFHLSYGYLTQNDEYYDDIATFRSQTASLDKNWLEFHWNIFTWLETSLSYIFVNDYFASVEGGSTVVYTPDQYQQIGIDLTGNFPIGNWVLLTSYSYKLAAKSSEGVEYIDSNYKVEFLYRLSSSLLGLSHMRRFRSKVGENFENFHTDSGFGIDYLFPF